MQRGAFAHLAIQGTQLAVRVTPNVAPAGVMLEDGILRVRSRPCPKTEKPTRQYRRCWQKALAWQEPD